MDRWHVVLDACFPRYCVNCEQEGSLLCSQCLADLSFDGPPFAYANPVIRRLICAWKYDGDENGLFALSRLLASRLATLRLQLRAANIHAIIPIPLSEWKERWRGFHQVRDLSHVIGGMLDVPVIDVLERRHGLKAQANLTHEMREQSLKKNPMRVRRGCEMPKCVLLVDDVETTGATMDAAEVVLKDAGVECVVRWSLAKG